MPDKPASKPIAKGLARGNGFVGQFALPGMVPQVVQKDGAAQKFATEEQAAAAAAFALVDALAFRSASSEKTKEYARLSGVKLGLLIAAADMTPSAFARVYGVPRDRVMKWLSGEQDIPHSAHLIARLVVNEATRAEIEAITADALERGRS